MKFITLEKLCVIVRINPEDWINMKVSSYRNKYSHCRGKTILRMSYRFNEIYCTRKTISLHRVGTLLPLSLTHWGQVTHICLGKLVILGSDNGLSPERCQTIIWTNAGILLIGPLGTNFSEILSEIHRKYVWKCLRNVGHFVSTSMCKVICVATQLTTITSDIQWGSVNPIL